MCRVSVNTRNASILYCDTCTMSNYSILGIRILRNQRIQIPVNTYLAGGLWGTRGYCRGALRLRSSLESVVTRLTDEGGACFVVVGYCFSNIVRKTAVTAEMTGEDRDDSKYERHQRDKWRAIKRMEIVMGRGERFRERGRGETASVRAEGEMGFRGSSRIIIIKEFNSVAVSLG